MSGKFKHLLRMSGITSAMLALAVATADSGCGTWSGNPKNPSPPAPQPPSNVPVIEPVSVTLRARATSGAALSTAETITVRGKDGASAGTITLTQARVVLKEIRIRASAGDAAIREKFEGPYIVDLMNDRVLPDPGAISLAAGSYSRVELRLHKLDKDANAVGENDPLLDHSIHLAGTYTDAEGRARPFELTHDVSEEFGLEATTPLDLKAGVANAVVLAFQQSIWFDLTGAEVDLGDILGDVVLDEDADDSAKKVRDRIKENLKRSARPERE